METDPYISFQTPGDLSPSVVPTVHHAARIKTVWSHTHTKKPKSTKFQKNQPFSAMNLDVPNKSRSAYKLH